MPNWILSTGEYVDGVGYQSQAVGAVERLVLTMPHPPQSTETTTLTGVHLKIHLAGAAASPAYFTLWDTPTTPETYDISGLLSPGDNVVEFAVDKVIGAAAFIAITLQSEDTITLTEVMLRTADCTYVYDVCIEQWSWYDTKYAAQLSSIVPSQLDAWSWRMDWAHNGGGTAGQYQPRLWALQTVGSQLAQVEIDIEFFGTGYFWGGGKAYQASVPGGSSQEITNKSYSVDTSTHKRAWYVLTANRYLSSAHCEFRGMYGSGYVLYSIVDCVPYP
jgi:hypothetical protein